MKVFILEDNKTKFENVVKVLKKCYPEGLEIETSEFINQGLCKIFDGDFDLIILDNNLPRFTDKRNDIETGVCRYVLRYMYLEEYPIPTILCSSCDSPDVKKNLEFLSKEFDNCLGLVDYKIGSDDWKKDLINLINKYEEDTV